MSDLVMTLITGLLASITFLFLVYWFWKLYDRPSKKQLEVQEDKREKRKEMRMWKAVEAQMEQEKVEAESLAIMERKKAEMRVKAMPPAAGIMQTALATLDAPTEGEEYLDRFKPKVQDIEEVEVEEDLVEQIVDDSDVLLAPDLVEVRQDEGVIVEELLSELMDEPEEMLEQDEEESSAEDVEGELESADEEVEPESADEEVETESEDSTVEVPEVEWNEEESKDQDEGWAVGW